MNRRSVGKRRVWWRCLSCVWMFLAVAPTWGFVAHMDENGSTVRWALNPTDRRVSTNVVNPTTRAIRYFQGADGWSAANRAEELDAVRASFAQWQSVPGTRLRFEEGGVLAGKVDVNTEDGTNVVYWTKGTTVVGGGFDDITGRLGVTYISYFLSDLVLVEADTVFNGVQFRWFTDYFATHGVEESFFVEAVATHEIGHFVGLDHSPVGGATMMWRGLNGIGVQSGLSSDEIAAVVSIYPATGQAALVGRIRGRVLRQSAPVFGAAVFAEDPSGNMASGTVTRSDGTYEMPGLRPGAYTVRAAPLDPAGTGVFLVRGSEIHPDFLEARTDFQPSGPKAVTVTAGGVVTSDVVVATNVTPFRITFLRTVTRSRESYDVFPGPTVVELGTTNHYTGVLSSDLPRSGATLSVGGEGVLVGPTQFALSRFNDRVVYALITAKADAASGLRSLRVEANGLVAYANGFLEVGPEVPDWNFDGLDDRFQRRYFRPWTRAEARPERDPDLDGLTNAQEERNIGDPTDPLSRGFRVLTAETAGTGSTVTSQGMPGRWFQIRWRPTASGGVWRAVGDRVRATGFQVQLTETNSTGPLRFFRVETIP